MKTTDHLPIDIKAHSIKTLHAPLYKGLSIEGFLEEGAKDPRVMDYLPDERDMPRMPR